RLFKLNPLSIFSSPVQRFARVGLNTKTYLVAFGSKDGSIGSISLKILPATGPTLSLAATALPISHGKLRNRSARPSRRDCKYPWCAARARYASQQDDIKTATPLSLIVVSSCLCYGNCCRSDLGSLAERPSIQIRRDETGYKTKRKGKRIGKPRGCMGFGRGGDIKQA